MAKRHKRGWSTPTRLIVSVAWYDDVNWAKLKQVAADVDSLHDSYEEWKDDAENVERELRRKGLVIQRIQINVEALIAWCQSNKKPNNGESRTQYTVELTRAQDGS